MKTSEYLNIAVLPGDGIGAEVIHAAIPVFEALQIPVTLHFGDIGWMYWQKEGTPIPDRTWKLIKESDSVLLGAITSKPLRESRKEISSKLQGNHHDYLSPIIQLRQKLDLFANIRPCFAINRNAKPFNFCIIRENTEGLYAGFDYLSLPEPMSHLLAEHSYWKDIPTNEMSCTLRLQSKAGLLRIFQFAFHYASAHGMNRVTFADKPNVLRLSGEFAREIFETVAGQYPHIHADILNVDALALWLIRRPEEFGVIVCENMFGDILSDVGAGVMGGLGFAPSANIGLRGSYFEPVHGSGPRMQQNSANPSAMFLTISMLLKHHGFVNQAKKIMDAVIAIVNDNQFVTYDLGGSSNTIDMAEAIIAHCSLSEQRNTPVKNNKRPTETPVDDMLVAQYVQQLKNYSTAEISDALDACQVEGALLHIKPLSPGMTLIGPAYTVKYLPNKEKTTGFKNAANYIDNIPPDSVIVIDNNGQIDCTVWGDILTETALQKKIAGTVVHGAVRDVSRIRDLRYPLFCTDVYMRSGKNRIHKTAEQCPLMMNEVVIHPGDIIFADDNGVLVIPRSLLTQVMNYIKNIKRTEQHIKSAVSSGSTLEEARNNFHYDKPWLDSQ